MRPHRYGHKQRLPQWARAALHPSVRDKLNGELRTWRATLQNDPCSYCGRARRRSRPHRRAAKRRTRQVAEPGGPRATGATGRREAARCWRSWPACTSTIDLGGAVLARTSAASESPPRTWTRRRAAANRTDGERATCSRRSCARGPMRKEPWATANATKAEDVDQRGSMCSRRRQAAPTPEQYAGGSAEAAPEQGAAPRAANRSSQQSTTVEDRTGNRARGD